MDFRTACHRDKGDCKDGLTAFTVKKCGEYRGGELCFPEYHIGLNVEQGDLLLFNPHIAHCNNPIIGKGRMSFVLYLREKMDKCS
jgi:predicted 2-oxoglutarate/Fe(II)-dependent dioxygenase YbiX